MARYWFAYRPDLNKAIDDPAGYRQVNRAIAGYPPCFIGANICVIYTLGTTGQPNSLPGEVAFSANLQTYINNSVSTNMPLPVTGKYFLYKIN